MTAAGAIPSDRNPKFPAGMRVLAVDDDATCLKLLDTLLRKCQYHVTTTTHAVTALEMLRENKTMFDLVISDVHMPDMDGFKLLELVGLEMDLPVISKSKPSPLLECINAFIGSVLSAYDDTEHVMKGVDHGACDYLLKPVRIEELKNIWQHVIRRKKIDIKDQKSVDKPNEDIVEAGEGFTKEEETYQNDTSTRKRKDQNEDEYEEFDRDGDYNEDSSMQKKPRLVWTPELHRQFVTAVNQLGMDKAVPKKILEMMNVKSVTRENVASHLQKYRGYLKRIRETASHQSNMVSVLGRADSPYIRGGSMNGFGELHSFAMSGQIQNAAFRSFPQGGVLGRLNSPGIGILGVSSSGIQRNQAQNSVIHGPGVSNLLSRIKPENQNGNILHGVPLSVGFDQLQLNRNVPRIGELSVSSNESNIYAISNVFPSGRTVVDGSINYVQNNRVAVENHIQSTQRVGVFGNQSLNPLNSECSQALGFERFDGNWLNAGVHMGTSPHMGTDPHARLSDQRSDLQCQVALASSSASQNMNFMQNRDLDGQDEYKSHMSNPINSSMDPLIAPHYGMGLTDQRLDSESMISYNSHDCSLVGESNFLDPLPLLHNDVEQPAAQTTELNYGNLMGETNPNGSYALSRTDSLEDLVTVLTREDESILNTKGGDFGLCS